MIAPKDEQIEALLGHRAFQVPTLNCSNGYKIERFCSNQACKHDSLCCDEESCECESQHQYCSLKKLRQLNKSLQGRLSLNCKIFRGLFAIQDELMNKLMTNRMLIIQKSKEWKYGNYSALVDSIYFKNIIKGIKGKEMNELFSGLSNKAAIEKQAQQYLASYKAEGEGMVSKLQALRSSLFQNLAKVKIEPSKKKEIPSKLQKLSIPSKILLEDKEGLQKYSFLFKQLNSSQLKLLFRASQHNFSAAKFHQCCDGISDTVTIVRTEFGRSIAAYTPLKWGTVNGDFVADDSRRSFLLQLELREKMSLTEIRYAIQNYSNWGPCFGFNDLYIADKCNQNQSSYSNFPVSYGSNDKYQQKSQQSRIAFCGSPKGCSFRVVEYEVFVVVFK